MTLASALYGAGIKSIQRGEITIANATTSNTATISAVSTSKSVVIHAGNSYTGTGLSSSLARLVLTNATTITATRGSSNGDLIVSYAVVEYY